jgi:acetoin utilization deacetylase AcuC-like enzyme
MGATGRLRGLWDRVAGPRPARPALFLHSDDYRVDIPGVTYDPRKGERILSYLLEQRLIGRRHVAAPGIASLHALGRVHTDAYLESLDRPDALTRAFGHTVPEELQQRVLRAQRAVVAGTVAAARRAVAEELFAVNLGGGLHHALPDRAQGFCVFNDVAVAVRTLRDDGWDAPVLVVDLDLHDGDGTRAVFADDSTVFTLSIHNRHWSVAPAAGSISVELPGEVDDATYLDAVETHLRACLDAFRPALVFYLAGTDPAETDRIGNWRISAAGMLQRDRRVLEMVEERAGRLPWVVLLAGGYGGESWRYSARFLAGVLSGWAGLEPPTTEAQTLARYRELVAGLRQDQLVGERAGALFELTEEDLGLGPTAHHRTRWLGALTPLGVDLLFERTGFLDRLRETGFSGPTLSLDLAHPAGQTLRIHAAEIAEPLVELRLVPDRRTVPGLELLSIEWMLLQDPRSRFERPQRRLPGQRYPGLGLLNDMMALLVSLAERLQIDGLVFVPSQYHLAVKAHRFLGFTSREDAAWFADLERRIGDLPLPEATRAVADGRILDDGGRPIARRPVPMVLPVSDRARARLAVVASRSLEPLRR